MSNNTIVLQIRDGTTNHIASSFVFTAMYPGEQATIETVNTVLHLLLNKHFMTVENNECAGVKLNMTSIQRREKEIKSQQT